MVNRENIAMALIDVELLGLRIWVRIDSPLVVTLTGMTRV